MSILLSVSQEGWKFFNRGKIGVKKVLDVENGVKSRGSYEATFSTHDLPSGVYFIRYQGIKVHGKKILVIK